MNMSINLNDRQIAIINLLKKQGEGSLSALYMQLGVDMSERTINRDLAELVRLGVLSTQGGGRSLVYTLNLSGRFFLPVDISSYNEQEPDSRVGVLPRYQFDVWKVWPASLFEPTVLDSLQTETVQYQKSISNQTPDVRARELERFVIEMSWKSARIEGNTYTLLDTERLLKEGIASLTNSPEETRMILNHKSAFTFVREQSKETIITRSYIEHVHMLLMQELLVDLGLRKSSVGITGSVYRPLDNQFQLQEALDALIHLVNSRESVFDKALTILLGLSYIQPFVDGNKRTARLVANGILLAHGAAPLSYRNVDEVLYRASLLAFYEQLTVVPMLDIFTDQYKFSVEHYS
jgi:Fic family protein